MNKKAKMLLCLLMPVILLASCSKNNPVSPSQSSVDGQLTFALAAEDNIASGQVVITKGAITQTLPITISNHTGSVTFNTIQVGTWHIVIQLFDAQGVEIYSGAENALVVKNQTTTARVRVNHNTGNLIVIVEVPGLILWNKMGSAEEVNNSAIGPNGQIDGALDYMAAQFGNGLKSQERMGDKNIPANFVKFENVKLQPQGCVEFWYQPSWSNSGVGHVINLIEYGTPENATGMNMTFAYNDWQNVMAFGVYDEGQQQAAGVHFVPEQTPGWSTSAPFHVACVWDANAANPNERAMVFINGQKIGNSSASGNTNFVWSADKVLYISSRTYSGDWDRHNWEGGEGIIDNLKIWNYSKTDFSDRFTEN